MTDAQAKYLAGVERDRREREKELLIFLLLMLARAQAHSIVAVKHGDDPIKTINNVVLGNPALDQAGIALAVAESMALAHQDGFRRASRYGGMPLDRDAAGTVDELAKLYNPSAQQTAAAIAKTAGAAVTDAIEAVSRTGGAMADVVRSIRSGFDSIGYTRADAFGLSAGAERNIVSANNTGTFAAATALNEIGGIAHITEVDDDTTDICMDRVGLQLAADDPYWSNGGIPQLHWGCRSILLPLLPGFDESAWRPTIPPMPGFGYGIAPFVSATA